MDAHRSDFNDIVKRLGTNMQNALSELQQNHASDLDFAKREQEQVIIDFQETLTNKNEELLKEQVEIINKIKDDIAKTMELDQSKIYTHVNELVSNSNKTMENSISKNLVRQIKEQERVITKMTDSINDIMATNKAESVRNTATHDMLQENMDLMEKLNQKCDSQNLAIIANREMLDEKLAIFERGVTEELKAVTAQLDLKIFEDSLAQTENYIAR